MKRHIKSIAAAAIAFSMPLAVAPAAMAQDVPADLGEVTEQTAEEAPEGVESDETDDEEKFDPYADENGLHHTNFVHWDRLPEKEKAENKKQNGHWSNSVADEKKDGWNVHVAKTGTKSMAGQEIPFVLIRPKNAPDTENLPTVYMLNGADGGEGRANWIAQSDIIKYYSDPASDGFVNANIVIPMRGAFSYYTDWVNKYSQAGYQPMWETYLTEELPQYLADAGVRMNDKKAIAGMSMSATSSLAIASHQLAEDKAYDAVGSFSGCASTTQGMAPAFINITLNRGGTNMDEMWGGTNSEEALKNDMVLNAAWLKDQKNMYVSNGSGLVGKHDVLSSDRVDGNLAGAAQVAVEGGVIEMATNQCTHDFKAKLDAEGKDDVTWNFRNQGTHQWGYWEDDLRGFAPVLQRAFDQEKK